MQEAGAGPGPRRTKANRTLFMWVGMQSVAVAVMREQTGFATALPTPSPGGLALSGGFVSEAAAAAADNNAWCCDSARTHWQTSLQCTCSCLRAGACHSLEEKQTTAIAQSA
jgi:hypothetical protein